MKTIRSPLFHPAASSGRTSGVQRHLRPHGRRRHPVIFSGVLLALLICGDALAASASTLHVRTNYQALVLYYNPHVRIGDQYRRVREAYGYRDIDLLCQDYATFLRRASGGQVNFSVVARYELDEFPPDNDPAVTFTPDNYDDYRRQGYDLFDSGKADYPAICNDPRFRIVPRVEAGEVDAVWIFSPDFTGFWETAMAGRDSYWINGGEYPEIECSRRFVVYGFGMASHQGVGFMLENTAHMTENILGNRIAAAWPAVHRITNSTTLNLANPTRRPQARLLNDWEYFTVSDAVHWDARLVTAGGSQAGISHFPPTACVNYGWSPVRVRFHGHWELENFESYGGTWQLGGGSLNVLGHSDPRAILYGSHTLRDNRGEYRVPVIITDADVEAGVLVQSDAATACAGLLLRCSKYAGNLSEIRGYRLSLHPAGDRIELQTCGLEPRVLACSSVTIEPNVAYPLHIALRGATITVALARGTPPVLVYDNATNAVDGAVGFFAQDTDAAFSHLNVTPVIVNHAESWRSYPVLASTSRILSPLEWQGDGRPYEDNDYWFAWWYEHLPKSAGTHDVHDPGTGQRLGRALNSWWPYIFDINRFDGPFLPDAEIISAPADLEPPQPPETARGVAVSATAIRLEWVEPDDNVGVTRYEVHRDHVLLRETPLRHFEDHGLSPDTEYSYHVKARDGSGNVSAASDPVLVKTLPNGMCLVNGDFEAGLGHPVGWNAEAFNTHSSFAWSQPGVGRNGTRCLVIDSRSDPNDARWIQQINGLMPHGRYQLRGWIKGEDITPEPNATVGANFCTLPDWNHSYPALTGTFDWTPVEVVVHADVDGSLTVGCRLGFWGSLARGIVWFDDLTLEFMPPEPFSVSVWGLNLSGVADPPNGLGDLIDIAASGSHLLALNRDGTITAWGSNWSGQAAPRPDLTDVLAIAAEGDCNIAVRIDGSVEAWGNNSHGQCIVPMGLTNVVAVAAGSRFIVALRMDGTVTAWGGNHWGETNVPDGLDRVVAIEAGQEFALALRDDGTVVAWGSFQGDDDQAYPAYVPADLHEVVAVACGSHHAVALRADGTVVAWGENASGQTNVPSQLNQVVAIAAGSNHVLALKSDGTVVAWGGNNHGQTDVPASLRNVYLIGAGSFYSVALTGGSAPVFTIRPSDYGSQANLFHLTIPSRSGRAYFLQYREALEDPSWRLLRGWLATGDTCRLEDSHAPASRRFYCVRTGPSQGPSQGPISIFDNWP